MNTEPAPRDGVLANFTPDAPLAGSVLMERPTAPILATIRLCKRFVVDGRPNTVFDEFDLAVEAGSFLSIVGPSGCGKSTLLKLLAGLESANSGAVFFKETQVSAPPQGVIYVFQQYTKSIFPWRTVQENVAFGLEHRRGLGRSGRLELCREYIRLVGLEGFEKYYPSQLSGGMQQRVAIARALVCKPDVLMMDEPFSAVDALTRTTLQRLMLTIWQTLPLTVVFVTHDVDEAIYLSQRVVSLSRAPARIDDDLAIDLTYPRDPVTARSEARYIAARERLLSRILAEEEAVAPVGLAARRVGNDP